MCEVGCRAADGGRDPPAYRAQLPPQRPCGDMPGSSLALLSLHLTACCGALGPGPARRGRRGFAASPLLAEPSGTVHTSHLVSDLPVPATRPPGAEMDRAEFAENQADNSSTRYVMAGALPATPVGERPRPGLQRRLCPLPRQEATRGND